MMEIELWEKAQVPRATVINLASRFIQDSGAFRWAIMSGPLGLDMVGQPFK